MRIVIEHDTLNMATTSLAPLVETPAADGGRGLDLVGTGDQPAAENAGAPPQWLLDAVTQAIEREGLAPGPTTGDAIDGGTASA
jgi:hypothetical protein